jgi:ribonuclease Z
MKITFLGTSSGAPTRRRNVSATAIQPERGKAWILVDCGEATQHQLLRTALSPQKLAAILITHIHGDHCYGLPGLLASCQLNGRTAPLIIVGPPAVWEYLQAVIRITELRIEYPLIFETVDQSLSLEAAGFNIQAAPLSHRTECWGYRLEEARVALKLDIDRLQQDAIPPGPIYNRLQRGEDAVLEDGRLLCSHDYTHPSHKPRAAVISGDNDTPEALTELCQGINLLVHEATYTEPVLERVGPEPQHTSAARVARFAQSEAIPSLILTHFSPRYVQKSRHVRDQGIDEIESEARLYYSGKLILAEDFASVQVNHDGSLSTVDTSKARPHIARSK